MGVKYDPNSYVRVLKLASILSWQEFSQIFKIAGADISLIGLLGFIIFAAVNFLPKGA